MEVDLTPRPGPILLDTTSALVQTWTPSSLIPKGWMRHHVFSNFQGRCFPNLLALAQDQKSLSLPRSEVSEIPRAEDYVGRCGA